MASKMHADNKNSEKLECYLINCAKSILPADISAAKAWLLTAKVLFPHQFGVQFLAYQIEKSTDNMKDTAKCFADLLAAFPNEKDLCTEIQAMTTALSKFEEQEGILENADFLVRLFYQLPLPVQRRMLLSCANNTPDTMEHCKLMLLLFRKFPSDVLLYGPEVMENLITAEKHSPLAGNPLNSFRKLLVCELLPLLAQSNIELPPQNLLRLLDKAVEFYVVCAFESYKRTRRDEREIGILDDPWTRLWDVIYHIGFKLKWELATYFTKYWSRETFFKTLNLFSKRLDEGSQRQVACCTLIVLLRCVHEYLPIVEPANNDPGFVLVEAFCQPETAQNGPPAKIQKTEEDINSPLVTAGAGASSQLVPSYLAAIRCLEILHSCEFVLRENLRLRSLWKVDPWLILFLSESSIYLGSYDHQNHGVRINPIVTELSKLTYSYQVRNNLHIVDSISKIAGMLNSLAFPGVFAANQLTVVTKKRRHIHFLPITRAAILQYIVKVLLQILKQNNNDLALGHILVLIQLNWPTESEELGKISDTVQMRGGFGYQMFTNYVINIDILERFAFLAGPNGPKLPLDIFAGSKQMHGQRRMSTRGVDKGAKEDFKMAMRNQVARWNEPVDELIIRFLKCEKELIQTSIIP